ncbi:hypothetical protein SSUST1_1301 [Streptococcus suis ST1]|nr:hypothetical protein SSUST1_1301 [Streptococcus suis ST1]VTT04815.1 Uncharacterised protein [Streptococcus suis]
MLLIIILPLKVYGRELLVCALVFILKKMKLKSNSSILFTFNYFGSYFDD